MSRLLCFGFGYTARMLEARLGDGWRVSGTSRDGTAGTSRFDRDHRLSAEAFADVTHILVSIPPVASGDPVLELHGNDIAALTDWDRGRSNLQWLGYLSTTGVYGDRGGGWVDENSELRPSGERGRRRVAAEKAWLALRQRHGVPVHIFRLAAIYGPRRSPFDALRARTARRIDKPGQVFSRIHVEDIAEVLIASMARPRPGAVYNVCDDEPAPPAEVTGHAAVLLGVMPSPPVPFEMAGLSPLAKSFWDDNKRVANTLIKQELGVTLRYPSYREGLAAILAAGG
jgi:nucleoside-diphosphate-sugar epimerase